MAFTKDGEDIDSDGNETGGETHVFLIAVFAFLILCYILAMCFERITALYTAYRGERLPTFIEFYAYAWILHPLRRIRVSWRRFILRFRNHALLNVPLDCALPQELFELILNFCYHDRETLLTCSLVYKAWVPASRRLLWLHVHSGDRVRELVKLLNLPDNTLSPYAQRVLLSMHTKKDGLIRYRHALRTLVNANARILRAKIVGKSLDPARALCRYFPHLRRLSFAYRDNGVAEERVAANFRLILIYSSLFCDLQRLSIHFTWQGNSTEDISLPSLQGIILPAGLRSLSLKSWNKDLLRWLKTHHATLRLTTFKLKIDGYSWCGLDPQPVNTLLMSCHTSLQFITLTIIQWENGPVPGLKDDFKRYSLVVFRFPRPWSVYGTSNGRVACLSHSLRKGYTIIIELEPH